MKNKLTLILAVGFAAHAAFAGEKRERVYIGIGGGTDVPVSNASFARPLLVKLTAGGPMEEDLTVQGDLEGLFYDLAGSPAYDCRLSIGLKLTAPTPAVQPYLYHGYGTSFQFGCSPGATSLLSFTVAAGAGFQAGIMDGIRFFGESKLNLLIHEGPASLDLPLAAGFTFPL